MKICSKRLAIFTKTWYSEIVDGGWHPSEKTESSLHDLKYMTKGATPIEKNVIVVDEQGNEYEATYPKRAKGLVKSGRARFVGENKICLACPPKENLEEQHMENTVSEHTYSIEYILSQMAKIQEQDSYIRDAILQVSSMEQPECFKNDREDESGDMAKYKKTNQLMFSLYEKMYSTKVRTIDDIVQCREKTNQQMLSLYEKMYDDLKSQSADKKQGAGNDLKSHTADKKQGLDKVINFA